MFYLGLRLFSLKNMLNKLNYDRTCVIIDRFRFILYDREQRAGHLGDAVFPFVRQARLAVAAMLCAGLCDRPTVGAGHAARLGGGFVATLASISAHHKRHVWMLHFIYNTE